MLAWTIAATGLLAANCSSDAADSNDASSTTVVATTPATDAAPPSAPVDTTEAAEPPAPDTTEPAATDSTDAAETTDTEPVATDSTAPPATDTTEAEEDEAEEDEGGESEWETGDSEDLFAQDELYTFEINLPEEALAELDADPAAEEYVEGSLTFEGETIEPIGIRYKGSIGAFVGCTASANPLAPDGPKVCTKLSMQLKMNWDDSNREFYGVRTVQLHSQNLDPTQMHERLGYWLFREMGVPAPRSTHARVFVNDEYVGVFALTEEVDGRFTRENFDDGTGNLYKEVWPIDGSGVPTAPDVLINGLETNEDEDPTADIITAFAAEVVAAAPEDRVAVIEQWADVDLMLRTFVVDRAIKNDDGALHWYCFTGACAPHNFYWYEDPTAEEVFFIPWDIDNAFDGLSNGGGVVGQFTLIADPWGEISNNCEPFPFGSFNLPQRSAACDPIIGALGSLDAEFDRLRADFVAGPFSEEQVNALLDEWAAQIEPAVAEAAAAHPDAPSVEAWRLAIDQLKAGLATARAGNGR